MDRDTKARSSGALRSGRARKRSWKELSGRQRVGLGLLAVVELVLTSVAARDLARRRPADVRGPRALWALVLGVQPVGPPLYLAVGRRRT